MTKNTPSLTPLVSPDWKDYELLDSGDGKKLERYGQYTFTRPESQAIWAPTLSRQRWASADGVFQPGGGERGGKWIFRKPVKSNWKMRYKNLQFYAQASASRHLGVFPEQAAHWDWIAELTKNHSRPNTDEETFRVLNLFGYTGLATLAASQAGAHVTHVDASRHAIKQARCNQALSGLEKRPIRWLVDDAGKFVKREIRRNSHYEGLILDPPAFGRGPKGHTWEFSKSLPALLKDCRKILSPRPIFLVLTAYAVPLSALSLYELLQGILTGLGGAFEAGELALIESSAGRHISTAIYARWRTDE
jgi:23S rRNA (cytosine1962-C5)-methyltransferase